MTNLGSLIKTRVITVAFELLFLPEADLSLTRLENDPGLSRGLSAVRRTLGRLERDPFDPQLRTRQFSTDDLDHNRVTPTGYGEWRVFWQLGEGPQTIEIVEIAQVSL